jgi:hypothetical protein
MRGAPLSDKQCSRNELTGEERFAKAAGAYVDVLTMETADVTGGRVGVGKGADQAWIIDRRRLK